MRMEGLTTLTNNNKDNRIDGDNCSDNDDNYMMKITSMAIIMMTITVIMSNENNADYGNYTYNSYSVCSFGLPASAKKAAIFENYWDWVFLCFVLLPSRPFTHRTHKSPEVFDQIFWE